MLGSDYEQECVILICCMTAELQILIRGGTEDNSKKLEISSISKKNILSSDPH